MQLDGSLRLREEAAGLLQELIRADTSNPPGNEVRAATVLRRYFASAGISCDFYSRDADRPNVVARIQGEGGPSLALLSHTDTVGANPGEWDRDPWSGDLVDDEVWGRGALDMKGQVAASAVAFASMHRDGFVPAGDLLFISAADEEVGDDYGLSWLVEEHPEAVRCDYALSEGGGERLVLNGRPFYLCATAEKMSAPFKLRVRGRGGHASMPELAENALIRAARYIDALGAYEPPRQLIPETRALLESVLGEPPASLEDALARAQSLNPLLGALLAPLLSFTLSPTMIAASQQRNVIPSVCEITVDCRLLPEQSPADVEPSIRAALGDGRYELEWLEAAGGTRSSFQSPLWDALAGFVANADPGAVLAPVVCPAFADNHYLREAFGTIVYGFFPIRQMDAEVAAKLVHSANERIAVDDLEFGVHVARAVAHSLPGQQPSVWDPGGPRVS
jgi:acetylornithine deacetylase/succinyl-diaminopimelate desuccinylase-like protein